MARRSKSATHDIPTPDALIEMMMLDWAPRRVRPGKVAGARYFAARRNRLSELYPGETLIVPTGHEKVRANDTSYRFRPGTDFYYLTGCLEPDCVLVLEPVGGARGGGHRSILFVEPNPGRSDKTFFTDRAKGELWVGPRLGVGESGSRFGVDEARGLPELAGYLSDLRSARSPFRLLRHMSGRVDRALPRQIRRDRPCAEALSEMRLFKDTFEIGLLQDAVDATERAFEDVIRALPQSTSERHVEGVFNLRARVEGNDVGYLTIAASAAHATILHWSDNYGTLDPSTLLLLDAGVEGNSLYTADVTRTLPIGGRFTPEQREVYDLVLEAQHAAFAEVRPGNDFLAPHKAAMVVLAKGLESMGVLASADDALDDDHQFYKRYTLHGVSHMLGLDVHDCAAARQEVYRYGTLGAGMCLTVEPGLYFQVDDLTVPPRYRGIGVRIEDDVVVTRGGHRNLSANIPSEPRDVEAWMARLWAEGPYRLP